MFAERLDFLMKVTNTKNSTLARAVVFDQSYVSKARRGLRRMVRNQTFVDRATDYFARNITEDYQKSVILKEMKIDPPWPDNEDATKAMLLNWLQNEAAPSYPVEQFITAMTDPPVRPAFPKAEYLASDGSRGDAAFYYGNKGKRDGVIAFLNALCSSGKPHTLFLHSDENMEWLFEDDTFARSWAALFGEFIGNGGRVKIIHSIGRDANEMWEAVQKWLPLYKSGAIEPYYYPRLRDGIYRRTLFVAAGHSALISSSVQGQQSETLNILLNDKKAVGALEKEFAAYLSLCRPLMEIVYPSDLKELTPLFQSFLAAPGKPLVSYLNDTLICVNENFGALIVKTEQPYVLFTLKESRMISAVEEYLENAPDGAARDNGSRHLDQLFGIK